MSRNTVKVGGYTLTVSMATLYRADEVLISKGRPTVMATFADVLEKLDLSSGTLDLSTLSGAMRVVSFPMLVTILTEFMRPTHNMSEKKALDGPLGEGLPGDWIAALFQLLLANVPQGDDAAESLDADGEPEGNDLAA